MLYSLYTTAGRILYKWCEIVMGYCYTSKQNRKNWYKTSSEIFTTHRTQNSKAYFNLSNNCFSSSQIIKLKG